MSYVRTSVHGSKRPAQPFERFFLNFVYPGALGVKAFEKFRFRPMYAGANTPNFLQGARDTAACAPFFKERRMKFVEPTGPNRKFGAMGHSSRGVG